MTYIEQVIRDAVTHGFSEERIQNRISCDDAHAHYFLDPAFWQALGKARGWEFSKSNNYEGWQLQWHRFIDHLAEGKDAESFFKELSTL